MSGELVSGVESPLPFDRVREHIREDAAYAWAWHCNVAMAILDTPFPPRVSIRQANEMAAHVMQNLFGVDTRDSREWELTVGNWR